MTSIMLNIIAVVASVVALIFSCKFYGLVGYRPLIVLPISLALSAAARVVRLLVVAGHLNVNLNFVADAICVFYVLLAVLVVILFKAASAYINNNHHYNGGKK